MSNEKYYQGLSISKENYYETHLIQTLYLCFVNNYFRYVLKAWQENMNIQPVFNECKAVIYVCSYF